jgi:hypothetical protein
MAVLAVALVCCIAKLLYDSFTLNFGRDDVLVLQMCMSDNVKKKYSDLQAIRMPGVVIEEKKVRNCVFFRDIYAAHHETIQ